MGSIAVQNGKETWRLRVGVGPTRVSGRNLNIQPPVPLGGRLHPVLSVTLKLQGRVGLACSDRPTVDSAFNLFFSSHTFWSEASLPMALYSFPM